MASYDDYTIGEILSQSVTWIGARAAVAQQQEALRSLLTRAAGQPLLLTGCGSQYYLALSVATLLRMYAHWPSLAVPASEIVFAPAGVGVIDRAPTLLVFSRSGETSEAIAAARLVRERGGAVIAVGCDAASTLLREADVAVEIVVGRERSLVQTRSSAGMLVAAHAIVALAAAIQQHDSSALNDGLARLADVGLAYIQRAHAEAGDQQTRGLALARNRAIKRIFVLGSGTRYGLACEAALKFQEMSLTIAEAFHTLEFRHGPMAMVDERALVIGLLGDTATAAELDVLREAHDCGAHTLVLADRTPSDLARIDAVFAFESQVPEPARDVLYLAPLQLMAYERAVAKGLNPDTPRNLAPFVRLDGVASST